jgi:hypothetical protein
MDVPRIDLRGHRFLADRVESMTSDERSKYAAALVRGSYIGTCLSCDTALYEHDGATECGGWSMTLGESFPALMCRKCREEDDDYRPCA